MAEDEESLVRRRPKRSTAGNRMEAALAEFALEELAPEPEDDNDFIGQDDEVEVFDSDFQSTDDEAMQEDEAAGEKMVVEEEKQARRTARQRAAKVTVAASARQRTAFRPSEVSPKAQTKAKRSARGQRRVSLGVAVDAETGEIMESVSKRKSGRRSTVLASQNLHVRLKDAEERRALMPKKVKEIAHTYTQAELIARALDTEEGNIIEHRDYLTKEEERRRRAQVVRKSISGPVLRWISKAEEVQVAVEPMAPATPQYGKFRQSFYQPTNTPVASTSASGSAGFTPPAFYQPPTGGSMTNPYLQASQSFPSAVFPPTVNPQPPQPQVRKEKFTKNYLVHELDQRDDVVRPSWEENMSAVLGDHVKWNEVKVYSAKYRPYARPVVRCLMSGRAANYRDPRTGVPFANVDAYKTLTRLLTHKFVWNEELGCYTASEEDGASAA